MDYVLVKYLHYVCILLLVCSLFTQHLLVKKQLTVIDLKRVRVMDAIYGISAIFVVLSGLILWFLVGKSSEFYSTNPIMHIKVFLFVVMIGLSIMPTMFFIKHKQTQTTIEVPKKIIMIIRFELLIVFILPLLATLMANGYRL